MDTLILAGLGVPLFFALSTVLPRSRAFASWLAPWAPLPALLLALFAADGRLDLPSVLLGTSLGLDAGGRPFLLFTALVWLLAGGFARGWLRDDADRGRFWAFFLATEAGNLGVCLALDAVSFYLFFALMSFAAYGLVVHSGSTQARHAGRVYLAMAVLGEVMLAAGMMLATDAAGSLLLAEVAATPPPAAALWLLLAGFGIKLGVPLLHMWLPLAHPVAPVPASAVLSGVLLKAGLIGWLRFLPLGVVELPHAGAVLMLAGLAAMFLGAAAGLCQREPKVLLAYSSVSQMGYLSLGVGAGLMAPEAWPLLLPAVLLYALHHALMKSALFLGAGWLQLYGATPLNLGLFALPALSLAGAPPSSGLLAKTALKIALQDLPFAWSGALGGLLFAAAFASALLMGRLLWLVREKYRPHPEAPSRAPPTDAAFVFWLLLVLASPGLVWLTADAPLRAEAMAPASQAAAVWPLLAAALTGMLALRRRWRAPQLPPGDVLAWLPRGPAPAGRLRIPAWPKWRRKQWPAVMPAVAVPPALAGAGWLIVLAAMLLAFLWKE